MVDREAREYWANQRRQMLKRDRRSRRGGGAPRVTTILVVAMVSGWLVESFAPGLLTRALELPGGTVLFILISTVLPGSLLGLVFAGLFVWLIGSQVEAFVRPWQYLVLFLGAGVVGGLVSHLAGGGLGGSYAAFGLAGAYAALMARHSAHGAAQWAVLLLIMNVVLSGFNLVLLIGMAASFVAGLIMARVMRLG